LFNQINAALVRLSIDHTYMDHNLIFFYFLFVISDLFVQQTGHHWDKSEVCSFRW